VTAGPDDASGATLEKILEEKRAHSTLFFRYEKSFQDHLAGRRAKGGQTPPRGPPRITSR
jgi:hypothetical protein